MLENRPYNFPNFIAEDFELPLTYIDPLIPVNSVTIFFGPFKSLKSMLVQQMALDIAAGLSFLNLFDIPIPRKVLYCQNELADVQLQNRWRVMIKNYSNICLDNLYYLNCKGMFLNDETSFNQFCKVINEIRPDIVILDSLYYALIGDVSDGAVVNTIIRKCDKMLQSYAPMSLVLVHHQRKVTNERPDLGMEEMLGSVQLAAWPSSLIRMKRDEIGQRKLQFMFRYYPDINPIDVKLDRDKLILQAENKVTATSIESTICSYLSYGDPKCYDEIFHLLRDEISIPRSKVSSSLNAMLKMGRVKKVSIDGSELFSLNVYQGNPAL